MTTSFPVLTLRIGLAGLALVGCSASEPSIPQPPPGPTATAPAVALANDWVTTSPGGRYLTVDDTPFLVTGNQPGTGFLDQPDDAIDAHFARMERFGETVARIDLDYAYPSENGEEPRYVGLESSLGAFDPARVARIDKTFELARKHGVRLLIVPFVTSPPMWETWSLNPYGTERGGPARDPNDFVTSPEAREAFGSRLEWIAERWGGSGTFFGWDLMNESDVLIPADAKNGARALGEWIQVMGERVAAKERALYGREHIRHVSWSELVPPPECAFLLDSPALNVASTHPYDSYGTTLGTYPKIVTSLVEPAKTVHSQLLGMLGHRLPDRRPFFENEHHQNDVMMLSLYREADHHLAWSELASGASGAGLTWLVHPSGAPRPHADFLERHEALGPSRQARAAFLAHRVPSRFFRSHTTDEAVDALVTSDPSVTLMGIRRDKVALGWIVGNDDACLRARGIDEIRKLRANGASVNALESALALLLWAQLFQADGVMIDKNRVAGVVAALRTHDEAAALAAEDPLFAHLDELESAHGSLGRVRACAKLRPTVAIKMPAGAYAVDWVDDRSGQLVRTDVLESGEGTVTAPEFENHLAMVVSERP